MNVRRGVQIAVKRTRNSILFEIHFSDNGIRSDLIRFEDRSDLIVLTLRKWIILMIVTLRTIEGQTQHRFRNMFNGLIEPAGTIELEILSSQKTRSTQRLQIVGIQLISRQHLAQHLIVWFVSVVRFNDPVSPVPNMFLRIPDLRTQSPPVAVAPDIHPVTTPSLAILRTCQQTVDNFFPCVR